MITLIVGKKLHFFVKMNESIGAYSVVLAYFAKSSLGWRLIGRWVFDQRLTVKSDRKRLYVIENQGRRYGLAMCEQLPPKNSKRSFFESPI